VSLCCAHCCTAQSKHQGGRRSEPGFG
jgi:hypothetical protein